MFYTVMYRVDYCPETEPLDKYNPSFSRLYGDRYKRARLNEDHQWQSLHSFDDLDSARQCLAYEVKAHKDYSPYRLLINTPDHVFLKQRLYPDYNAAYEVVILETPHSAEDCDTAL